MHGPVIKISCLFDMCLIFRTYVRAVQRNLTKTVLYNRIFHFKLLVWRQETRQITVMLAMSSSSNCEQRRRFYLQVTTKLWSHQKVFVWNKILVPSLCFPKRQCSKMKVRTVCRVRWLNVWSSNLHTLSHSKYRIPKPLQLYCICRPHRSVFWLAASREAFNRISTNILLEILLKFGDGISTDIWYREMLLTFGTGDPKAIWYQEILLTFGTRRFYWHLVQEILLPFGTRRFYWHFVPDILLTFGTRRSYWHLVQDILLTFDTGDSTDIWYQEILLTSGTGDSTDIWYQEILSTFGSGVSTGIWYKRFYWHLVPGDSTGIWYRRFYWHLLPGDYTDIWYRRFYWYLVPRDSTGIWYQEILLTLGTRRFYWRLVQEIALKFGTGNSTEIWRHILVLVKIGQHWRTLDNETDLHVCLHLLCDSLSAPWNTKMSGTEVVRTTKAHILCSLYFSCRW